MNSDANNSVNNGAELVLALDEENKAVFSRSPNLEQKYWVELLNFWSGGKQYDPSCESYSVSMQDLTNKREWLRFGWLNRGRQLLIRENLKEALKAHKNTIKEFEAANDFVRLNSLPEVDLEGISRSPTDEQLFNIRASLIIPSGANFSVPGAGKTTTTLIIWYLLRKQEAVQKLLVVCPKSAFNAWAVEEVSQTFDDPPKTQIFSAKGIDPQCEVLISNYETLENANHLDRILNWAKKNNIMLVLDEAHRVKAGGSSVRWRACDQIAHVAKRVELLTGTPLPQGYDDLRNLFRLSWRDLPENYLSDKLLSTLKRGGVFVRTTKKELKLPPLEIEEVFLKQSDLQKDIYDALRKQYSGVFNLSSASKEVFEKKGRAVMALLGAASNPGLLAGKFAEEAFLDLKWPPQEIQHDNDLMDLVSNYASMEIPPKYKWLIEFIEMSAREGKKTLVWSSFVGNLLAVQRLLKPYSPALVHGSIDQKSREIEIEKFRANPDCSVLITNPQTLGEGISLHHTCHQAVYIDRTYNAGHYLQSLDRIHRLGLPDETISKVFILISNLTIDNKVSTRLKSKIGRMAEALDDEGLTKVANPFFDDLDGHWSSAVDAQDFADLVQHLSE